MPRRKTVVPRKGKAKAVRPKTVEQQLSTGGRALFIIAQREVRKLHKGLSKDELRSRAMSYMASRLLVPVLRLKKPVLSALTGKDTRKAIAAYCVLSALRSQDGKRGQRFGGSDSAQSKEKDRQSVRESTTMRVRGFVLDNSEVGQYANDRGVLSRNCTRYIGDASQGIPDCKDDALTDSQMAVRDYVLGRLADEHFVEHYRRAVRGIIVLFGYNLKTEKKATDKEVTDAEARLVSRGCGDY